MVPTASIQTTVRPEDLLHSANAGVIIHRCAQLKNEFRSGGREFAREVSEHVNRTQVGTASLFVYEEAFGVHDRIHWLIHLTSLTDYVTLIAMAVHDETFRNIFLRERIPAEKGGGDWSRMFPDGSLHEHVLVPLPGAIPASPPVAEILHSANSGMLIERTGIARYEHRDQARQLALEVAARVRSCQSEVASMFVYEEMFGRQDRLHWLIHLRSLKSYPSFLAFWKGDSGLAEILGRERSAGARGWGLFLEGSLEETVLIPQFAGSSGTAKH